MKWFVTLLISAFLNAIIVFYGRGSFGAVVFTGVACLWIGLPLILLSAICIGIAKQYKLRRFRTVSAYGLLVALVIASTFISIPAGMRIHEHDIRTAKIFCENLIPKIELIKINTGAYPLDIVELLNENDLPRLFNPGTYQSDGDNFTFKIVTCMRGGDMFSSQRREWEPWD